MKSSYLVLYYHRIAGKRTPGHAHLDVHPRRFERQLRVLRRLGLRPLSPDELLAFHSDPSATIAGRRYVLAADDGIADTVSAFRRHIELRPQMFVCTEYVGRRRYGRTTRRSPAGKSLASSADREVMSARTHGVIRLLPSSPLMSWRQSWPGPCATWSRICRAYPLPRLPAWGPRRARTLGRYRGGIRGRFTTEPGRNGAGTDLTASGGSNPRIGTARSFSYGQR